MENNKTSLTVILVTYNHEQYIAKSLESILNQKDVDYKILVADDGSTDDTVKIIKSIAQSNTHMKFDFLDYSSNLGITKNYQRAFGACETEYTAIMEGDDLWISPFKLHRQLDFLQTNWECQMCSANYYVFQDQSRQYQLRVADTKGELMITSRDLIRDNIVGNFSTCMYRTAALKRLPEKLFQEKSYDWIINICIGMNGLIGFIKEPMSFYRLHEKGTWTQMSSTEQFESQRAQLKIYNTITDNLYQDEFNTLHTQLTNQIKQVRIKEMIGSRLPLPKINRFLTRLSSVTPPVFILLLKLLTPPFIQARLSILTSNKGV